MALRMLSRLGWPWDCFKSSDAPCCTILDEYALQDRWHPSCYGLRVGDVPVTRNMELRDVTEGSTFVS